MADKQVQGEVKRRGFGPPPLVIFNTIFAFIISQFLTYFLLVLGFSLWRGAQNQNLTYDQTINSLNDYLNHSLVFQFLSIFLAEGLVVLLVWLFLKRRGLKFGSIGLSRKPNWEDLKQAILGFGAYYALFIIIAAALVLLIPELNSNQQQDVGFTDINTPLASVVAFISLVILPPIGEETLMRGYLYTGLRKSLSFVPAMIITSILFGAAHLLTGVGPGLLWLAGIETFILSIILVYLREKTGALYAGILVHALNNVVAFFVHFHN